jgi:hypothetical protein
MESMYHRKMIRITLFSILAAMLFALLYAAFEVYFKPCRFFSCTPVILGIAEYQLIVMLPVFILASCLITYSFTRHDSSFNSLQNLFFTAGILSFLAFMEDAFFFVVCGCPITPGLYTTKWGYIATPAFTLPLWYVFAVALSSICFYVSYRLGNRKVP